MLEVYFVIAVFITIFSTIAAIVLSFIYLMERDSAYDDTRGNARRMLTAYACIILAWTWPLTAPLAVLYLLLSAAKDAV